MSSFLNSIKNSTVSSLFKFSLSSNLVKPHLLQSPYLISFPSNTGRFSNNNFSSINLRNNRKLLSTSSTNNIVMKAISTREESISKRIWVKCQKESKFAMFTPFIVCLAAGNLDMKAFANYIAQDFYYLTAFSQACKLAEDYAEDDDNKNAIMEFRNGVTNELKMHNSFVREWGLDPTKETTLNPATIRYTEFLLAIASGKVEGEKVNGKILTPYEKIRIVAYTIGAMTPCMRLYAFLGKEIRALVSPQETTHPYKKWIDSYSSLDFEASALKTEKLLDKLSIPLKGEELELLEKFYQEAMEHEIDFFSSQPVIQETLFPLSKMIDPKKKSLLLVSDFDYTCTCAVDQSYDSLVKIAILTAIKNEKGQDDHEGKVLCGMSSIDLKKTWDILSADYHKDYEQCIMKILPHEKGDKFDYEGLSKAIKQLSEFEKWANQRVIDSGVLKGINLEDIKLAGEHMIIKDGCIDLFEKVLKNENLNASIHILSCCWCADLLRSAFASEGLDGMTIRANEFIYKDEVSTGEILGGVESPLEKVEVFKEIVKKNENESSKKLMTVYIGDSVGDLLCLLEADIGIVMGSNETLRRLATQFGVSFVPLFQGLVEKERKFVESGESAGWKGLSGTLYMVDSWTEIHALILGHHRM